MATIESKDFWDLRDLAELARDCGIEIESPEDYDAEDIQDSKDTLKALASLAEDLNQSCDEEDADSVAEALEAAMNVYGPTLISEDHFEEAMKQDVKELGYLPDEMPWWLENAIDWSQVAESLQQDYTSVSFDGADWYIR
jgi:hypothetical protein